MESSSAPPNRNYLRYQTGRFAMSAEVTNATLSDDTVVLDFDYMTYPYETFRGGKHGPNRNPERIIEGAIRSIMVRQVNQKFKSLIRKV